MYITSLPTAQRSHKILIKELDGDYTRHNERASVLVCNL